MTTGATNDDHGVLPDEVRRGLTGLELLRGIVEGRFPQPPIGSALDFSLREVAHGTATFEGRPTDRLLNPFGTVHGGWAATLLDSCMTCAILSTIERGSGLTTVEIKVNYVRAMTAATGLVRAEGRVIHAGKRLVTAEGRLTDSEQRLLAHGTTTCLILQL